MTNLDNNIANQEQDAAHLQEDNSEQFYQDDSNDTDNIPRLTADFAQAQDTPSDTINNSTTAANNVFV